MKLPEEVIILEGKMVTVTEKDLDQLEQEC